MSTRLARLLVGADVVLEASRPRALEQLGLDARALVAGGGPRVWASITGHGRTGSERDRVGFGDDAAVAGGLVAWGEQRPHFVADAVADPATGLIAAAAVVDALAQGGRWLLDISLAGVAAHLRGPTLPLGPRPIEVPRPPPPLRPRPRLPPSARTPAPCCAGSGGLPTRLECAGVDFDAYLNDIPLLHHWGGEWRRGGFDGRFLRAISEAILAHGEHPRIIETGAG